jgi:hypothetical protein
MATTKKCMSCGGSSRMAKGGTAKSSCPPGERMVRGICTPKALSSTSARIGVGTVLAGAAGMIGSAIKNKVAEKKAKKMEAAKEAAKNKEMAKEKKGGAVKKYAMGGSAGIVGMPKYSNNPRSYSGASLKKGGSIKKAAVGMTVDTGMPVRPEIKKKTKPTMSKVQDKAKFGSSVPVQHSPAAGRVRSASGMGTVPVGKRKMGGATKKK